MRPQTLAFAPQKTTLSKTVHQRSTDSSSSLSPALVLGFYSLKESQETFARWAQIMGQSYAPSTHQSSKRGPRVSYVSPWTVVHQLGLTLPESTLSWILGNQGWIQVSFESPPDASSQWSGKDQSHHQVSNWSCQHVLVNHPYLSSHPIAPMSHSKPPRFFWTVALVVVFWSD